MSEPKHAAPPEAAAPAPNALPLVRVVDDEPTIQALFRRMATLGGFEVATWGAFLAPAATPRPSAARLSQEVARVVKTPAIQARMAEGRGQITVRVVLERDINDAANDVREKVAGAIRNMPPALLPPVITKVAG